VTTVITDTPTAERATEHGAAVVAAYFGALLPRLAEHAAAMAATLAGHDRSTLTASRIDDLIAPHAHDLLDHPEEPVYGAGFIAAMDLVSDAPSHLAWWQGADRRKLVFPAQSVKQAIDYRELEWFRVPSATGRPHVAGPYVDYLCSDEYTMTAAAPVIVDGRFAGVAGLDVLVDTVERRLTPPLRALGVPLILVNGVGRVLVSTDPAYAAGDVLRPGQVRIAAQRRCASVDLDVIVAD
jgi:hypothetical protein